MELADYASESVILYDLAGSIRYCNPASAELYGWSQAGNLHVDGPSWKSIVAGDRAAIEISTPLGDHEAIVVSVRDNGPGIPDNDLGRVFDGFFTTKSDGMGIGLAIRQSIASSHGGAMAANHPDGGALFTLPVPREPRQVQRPALAQGALS